MCKKLCLLFIVLFWNFNCSKDNYSINDLGFVEDLDTPEENQNTNNQTNFKLLALGDSYTIGEGVCDTCSFPEQLKDKLKSEMGADKTFDLKIIAQTGWTTSRLINAINDENLSKDYDLVTLLIGVNNQFQGLSFSIFEREFNQLIDKSIVIAKGDKSNIIVISIPDYSFTPYGANFASTVNVSAQIDNYNAFIQSFCDSNNLDFVNITDLSRTGLTNTSLVADDGLHLSTLAYNRVVNLMLPLVLKKLNN
ncbi:SGNH/GDSL hydrolase family protein [Seonamhaeicola aphaedonensis]|uniref:Lysophospholipase L1-like esterase n=1 Tax=Seonamhaeicola aphaedonensis TaxID=1461338 RepID=A0A3D9H5H8_9FLAO|nr:SGNH/GDSL hydrolase family protein [Seonamhaeicola aphaedonensis]RED44740.1 lysophospholipase L1-like esterase [Seonamhaeicola aphaedonensis]